MCLYRYFGMLIVAPNAVLSEIIEFFGELNYLYSMSYIETFYSNYMVIADKLLTLFFCTLIYIYLFCFLIIKLPDSN